MAHPAGFKDVENARAFFIGIGLQKNILRGDVKREA
jgi:hypothetical protein